MQIKEVEQKLNISKRNLRFYEERGLVAPKRNPKNGYREYTEEDVSRLKTIAFYRSLGLSIETIKELFDGKKRLEQAIEKQIQKLKKDLENLSIMKEQCKHFQYQLEGKQDIIYDLEDLTKINPDAVREIIEQIDAVSLVKAARGVSPDVRQYLEKLRSDIDFSKEWRNQGAVRIEEVEECQSMLLLAINRRM